MYQTYHSHCGTLSRYDWVDQNANRSPDDYPYSFDAYYIWREDISKSSPVYSDRMWQNDYEKAKVSFGNLGQRGNYTEKQCKEIIEKYYDGKYECVGFALACNVSSGYEIGIFFLKGKNND